MTKKKRKKERKTSQGKNFIMFMELQWKWKILIQKKTSLEESKEEEKRMKLKLKKNVRLANNFPKTGEGITFFSGTGESLEEDLKTFFTDENQLPPFFPIVEERICFLIRHHNHMHYKIRHVRTSKGEL